jgi:hypothetical protein
VTLNIRPSITAIASFAQDPNPDLKAAVPNLIPQLQTREFETVSASGYKPAPDELETLRAISPKTFPSEVEPVIVLAIEESKGKGESSNSTLKRTRPRIR